MTERQATRRHRRVYAPKTNYEWWLGREKVMPAKPRDDELAPSSSPTEPTSMGKEPIALAYLKQVLMKEQSAE